MVFDISKVSGIGEYTEKTETVDEKTRTLYFKDEKAFLVVNKNTIEVRTDAEARHNHFIIGIFCIEMCKIFVNQLIYKFKEHILTHHYCSIFLNCY